MAFAHGGQPEGTRGKKVDETSKSQPHRETVPFKLGIIAVFFTIGPHAIGKKRQGEKKEKEGGKRRLCRGEGGRKRGLTGIVKRLAPIRIATTDLRKGGGGQDIQAGCGSQYQQCESQSLGITFEVLLPSWKAVHVCRSKQKRPGKKKGREKSGALFGGCLQPTFRLD